MPIIDGNFWGPQETYDLLDHLADLTTLLICQIRGEFGLEKLDKRLQEDVEQ